MDMKIRKIGRRETYFQGRAVQRTAPVNMFTGAVYGMTRPLNRFPGRLITRIAPGNVFPGAGKWPAPRNLNF